MDIFHLSDTLMVCKFWQSANMLPVSVTLDVSNELRSSSVSDPSQPNIPPMLVMLEVFTLSSFIVLSDEQLWNMLFAIGQLEKSKFDRFTEFKFVHPFNM